MRTQQEVINQMYEMLMYHQLNIHNVQTFYEKPSHFTAIPVAQASENLKALYKIYREGMLYRKYTKSNRTSVWWLPTDGDAEVVGGWKASEMAYKDWNVVYIVKAFVEPLNTFIAILREEGYEVTFRLGCLPHEYAIGIRNLIRHRLGKAVDIGIDKPMTEEVMRRVSEESKPFCLGIKIYPDWIHVFLRQRGCYQFLTSQSYHCCVLSHNFPVT